jgi:ABC-type molybdenum transport system ATPase subunit/photorepair protein PhrA
MSQAVLSLKNVTIYQEDKVILSNINLEVKEVILHVIENGIRKSSLMKTLYADLPLTEGEGHIVDLIPSRKMIFRFKKKNWNCLQDFATTRSFDKR